MAEYNTLKEKTIEFGNNNFLEVSIKTYNDGEREVVYVSLSRGFVNRDGNKIYKKNFTIPYDKAVLDQIIEELKEISESL